MRIIDFYADWCRPCKMMASYFQKVQTDERLSDKNIEFFSVNVENDNKIPALNLSGLELAEKFKVRNIPTFLKIGSDGQEISRLTGAMPYEKLISWMAK